MPGMRGEEDEQPARRRAVDAFVRTGSCGERTVGGLTEQYYGDGDEDHEDMVVAE